MTIDTQKYKEKLEAELKRLVEELKTVGVQNPLIPGDWEPIPSSENNSQADENEVADSIDHFEENTAILKQLEIQYNEVRGALEKINNGTYGKCKVCGGEIEEARLDANPAAETCKTHINEH